MLSRCREKIPRCRGSRALSRIQYTVVTDSDRRHREMLKLLFECQATSMNVLYI